MQLDCITVENFRIFKDAEFRFDPSLNLIIGENGSGKTALLEAIKACVLDAGRALSGNWHNVAIANFEVRFETEIIGGRVRLERRYPSTLLASGQLLGKSLTWKIQRFSEANNPDSVIDIHRIIGDLVKTMNVGDAFSLPLLAFYGADRTGQHVDTNVEDAASEKALSRFDGYKNWHDAFVNLAELERWIITKTLERLQLLEEGLPVDSHIEQEELEVVNGAISNSIPGVKRLRYDLRLRNLMVEYHDRRAVPFSSLSTGQQSMIVLLADIARRMCLINPHLGQAVLRETEGIVGIDELDIHLHPRWQREVVKNLRRIFPRVQFFATSHSPQMIGGLNPKNILMLSQRGATHPHVTYGLDASSILEEIMNADSREPEVEEMIRYIFADIEAGDLKSAKQHLIKLRTNAPDLPDYSRIEALLRRKEVLGR